MRLQIEKSFRATGSKNKPCFFTDLLLISAAIVIFAHILDFDGNITKGRCGK